MWDIRKGLFTKVEKKYIQWGVIRGQIGGSRPGGTSVVLEDVAVPVAKLAEVTKDLQVLFKENNYNDVVIFGINKKRNN